MAISSLQRKTVLSFFFLKCPSTKLHHTYTHAKKKGTERQQAKEDAANILLTMTNCMDDAVLQTECCKFLLGYMCRFDSGRADLDQVSATKLVIKVVQNHPHDPKLQKLAWFLLCVLCKQIPRNMDIFLHGFVSCLTLCHMTTQKVRKKS